MMIDRKARRVLFVKASKEVVDFLFSLHALPVATNDAMSEKIVYRIMAVTDREMHGKVMSTYIEVVCATGLRWSPPDWPHRGACTFTCDAHWRADKR